MKEYWVKRVKKKFFVILLFGKKSKLAGIGVLNLFLIEVRFSFSLARFLSVFRSHF